MKLTIARLKKLIKEEMGKVRLHEGAIDWMLMAYWAQLESMLNHQGVKEPSTAVVKRTANLRTRRDMVVAVLLLRAFSKIVGMMQERYMSDVYQMSQEEELLQAYRQIQPNEVIEVLNILANEGATDLEGIAPEDIMDIGDQELMSIMNEYDPIGFYQQNQ